MQQQQKKVILKSYFSDALSNISIVDILYTALHQQVWSPCLQYWPSCEHQKVSEMQLLKSPYFREDGYSFDMVSEKYLGHESQQKVKKASSIKASDTPPT